MGGVGVGESSSAPTRWAEEVDHQAGIQRRKKGGAQWSGIHPRNLWLYNIDAGRNWYCGFEGAKLNLQFPFSSFALFLFIHGHAASR